MRIDLKIVGLYLGQCMISVTVLGSDGSVNKHELF